ncbi:YncE family protein [Streptosporangium canum]|uniref:YncE family protein n=1 Tax=Streptosporangium canum TaxID=324952 RepID=UPI003688010F
MAAPDVGAAPHGVSFAGDGREVWLSNWYSSQLTVVSASTLQVIARPRVGEELHHFAGRDMWVSDNRLGAISRINADTRRIAGNVRVGESPHLVAAVDGFVAVAVHGSGRAVFVDSSGRLKNSVEVGAGPHGLALVRAR